MPLETTTTKVKLQNATDSNWYWVELLSGGDFITFYCDGVAVAAGTTAYAILSGSDGNTYRWQLQTIEGEISPLLTLSPGVETADSVVLELGGLYYAITVIVTNEPGLLLTETTAPEPPAVVTPSPINVIISAPIGNWRIRNATKIY